MVSVVLSLDLDVGIQGNGVPILNRYIVYRAAVSSTLFRLRLLANGCSDFPLCVAPVELCRATALYPQRKARIAEKWFKVKKKNPSKKRRTPRRCLRKAAEGRGVSASRSSASGGARRKKRGLHRSVRPVPFCELFLISR